MKGQDEIMDNKYIRMKKQEQGQKVIYQIGDEEMREAMRKSTEFGIMFMKVTKKYEIGIVTHLVDKEFKIGMMYLY